MTDEYPLYLIPDGSARLDPARPANGMTNRNLERRYRRMVRRGRIKRWLVYPLFSVVVLAIGALLAMITYVHAAEDVLRQNPPVWRCFEDICFDAGNVHFSTAEPGQMLVYGKDSVSGGWVAVDCYAQLVGGEGVVLNVRDGSPLAKWCETMGDAE